MVSLPFGRHIANISLSDSTVRIMCELFHWKICFSFFLYLERLLWHNFPFSPLENLTVSTHSEEACLWCFGLFLFLFFLKKNVKNSVSFDRQNITTHLQVSIFCYLPNIGLATSMPLGKYPLLIKNGYEIPSWID